MVEVMPAILPLTGRLFEAGDEIRIQYSRPTGTLSAVKDLPDGGKAGISWSDFKRLSSEDYLAYVPELSSLECDFKINGGRPGEVIWQPHEGVPLKLVAPRKRDDWPISESLSSGEWRVLAELEVEAAWAVQREEGAAPMALVAPVMTPSVIALSEAHVLSTLGFAVGDEVLFVGMFEKGFTEDSAFRLSFPSEAARCAWINSLK